MQFDWNGLILYNTIHSYHDSALLILCIYGDILKVYAGFHV